MKKKPSDKAGQITSRQFPVTTNRDPFSRRLTTNELMSSFSIRSLTSYKRENY